MGMFGGETPEATKILGTDVSALVSLRRKMPKKIRDRFLESAPALTYSYYADGRLKTQSIVRNMKKSQVHPAGYGKAVIDSYVTWRKRRSENYLDASSSDSDYCDECPRTWPEARLGPLVRTMATKFPASRGGF